LVKVAVELEDRAVSFSFALIIFDVKLHRRLESRFT
jgi:hypothetical protein